MFLTETCVLKLSTNKGHFLLDSKSNEHMNRWAFLVFPHSFSDKFLHFKTIIGSLIINKLVDWLVDWLID